MRSYLLTIAYDGGPYSGWQRQDGFDTVQQRLENAFAELTGAPVQVHGAGRTDTGVHALRQTAHVRLERAWVPDTLRRALNASLPQSIAVRGVREVPPTFHARFSAIGKRYLYRFVVSEVRPVFAGGRAHWIRKPLAVDAMRAAARCLVGEHDLAAFATNPGYPRRRGTVRRVDHLHLARRPHGLDLVIQGNGFLYNMVRTIAGTLRDVGTRRIQPEAVAGILAAKDRRLAGMNCEAAGLYLVRVLYPREAFA